MRTPAALPVLTRTAESSMRVASRQDVPKGERKDAQVEPRRPVFDIEEVVLYPLREIARAAQIVDLRPTGDAGLHEMLLHVTRHAIAKLGDEFGALGPRTDERHLAAQHVHELRQLVEAEAAQEAAEACRPGFAVRRPDRARLVLGVQRH